MGVIVQLVPPPSLSPDGKGQAFLGLSQKSYSPDSLRLGVSPHGHSFQPSVPGADVNAVRSGGQGLHSEHACVRSRFAHAGCQDRAWGTALRGAGTRRTPRELHGYELRAATWPLLSHLSHHTSFP